MHLLNPPRSFRLGSFRGSSVYAGRPFLMDMDQLSVHMAVLGASGSGKSKTLELIIRHLLMMKEGGMVIDPAGDLTTNGMAFVGHRYRRGDEDLLRRVHYLELRPRSAFHLDPAARAPLRGVVTEIAYYSWLRAKVDTLAAAFLRRVPAADVEVMNRLKRWLKNVLTACLVAIDSRNTHVGLHKAFAFLNPQSDEFESLLNLVAAHLPEEVLTDFRKLYALRKRPSEQEKWLESTINRLREVLSPLVRAMFTPAPGRPSLDLKQINDKGHFVLVNLRPSKDFSHDQKVTVGGILIDELLTIKKAEQEQAADLRKRFALIVDESGEFLGEDLMDVGLRTMRKEALSIVLGAQNMHSLCRGDLDLGGQVLSLCDSILCFRQKLRLDKEAVADAAMAANLDFTRKLVEIQRQRGWVEHRTEEHSYSTNRTTTATKGGSLTTGGTTSEGGSRSNGGSESEGESRSEGTSSSCGSGMSRGHSLSAGRVAALGGSSSEGGSRSHAVGRAHGTARGETLALTTGHAESENGSHAHASGRGRGETVGASPIIVDGEVAAWIPTATQSTSSFESDSNTSGWGRSWNDSRTEGESLVRSQTDSVTDGHGTNWSKGKNWSVGRSETESEQESSSESWSEGESRSEGHHLVRGTNWSEGTSWATGKLQTEGKNWTDSAANGEGHSVAHKLQLLSNLVSEWEWTGLYEQGTPGDQREQHMHQIHTQDTAEAVFSFRGRHAHPVLIEQVKEYWTPRAKREIASIMIRVNRALRRYNFDPGLEPAPSPPTPPSLTPLPEADTPHIVADGADDNGFGA